MTGLALLEIFSRLRPEWLSALEALVLHESPSRDKPRLDALAQTIAERFRAIGGEVAILANPEGGDHVRARFFVESGEGKPGLILGHYDTVWPVGTLETMPFRVEGSRAFGPGVFDMKASLIEALFALRVLRETDQLPPRSIEVLVTSDEEIGSPTSRRIIEDLARSCAYALVLEPPLPDGSLKTARKGVGHFLLTIEGKAAHAGVEPEKGLSAIQELAHQILDLHALTDLEAGISVNVGVIEGGTTSNVIAARALARIDVRARTLEQASALDAAIRNRQPHQAGIQLTVQGGFNRPPMERTEGVVRLFERARAIGREIGLDLGEGSTGGGSDGNFTSAVGLPTLDGLGISGLGAHASHEQIDLDSFPERTTLLALLLRDL